MKNLEYITQVNVKLHLLAKAQIFHCTCWGGGGGGGGGGGRGGYAEVKTWYLHVSPAIFPTSPACGVWLQVTSA